MREFPEKSTVWERGYAGGSRVLELLMMRTVQLYVASPLDVIEIEQLRPLKSLQVLLDRFQSNLVEGEHVRFDQMWLAVKAATVVLKGYQPQKEQSLSKI